jgi:hypothetical protein
VEEAGRGRAGKHGNLAEAPMPLLVGVVLDIVCLLLDIYFLQLQTYVLRLDQVIMALSLVFLIPEVVLSLLACVFFFQTAGQF